MKHAILLKSLALALLIALVGLMALAEPNLNGVRAAANQPLAFRTGPNTAYGELYTLPQDTPIVAIELEEGNGVIWALVEFQHAGRRVRAYTGLKRLNLMDSVPYAEHERLKRSLVSGSTVYAAPDLNAEVRCTLPEGYEVVFLGFDGAYCFIEYSVSGALDRGYVREEAFMVDLGEFAEPFPDNPGDSWYAISASAPMYERPGGGELLFDIPFDASVTILFDEYYSAPDGWISLYYGGLHGYGRYDDFCDLRFDSPEQAREILGDWGE